MKMENVFSVVKLGESPSFGTGKSDIKKNPFPLFLPPDAPLDMGREKQWEVNGVECLFDGIPNSHGTIGWRFN